MQYSNIPDLHHYKTLNENRSIIEVLAYIRPYTSHKQNEFSGIWIFGRDNYLFLNLK